MLVPFAAAAGGLRGVTGDPRLLLGQGQEGVALGAAQAAAALFAPEERDEDEDQPKAEEYR
jgi:hypothetical protein